MGNVLSIVQDSIDYIYEKYYPKNNFLRPSYVSSLLLVTKIGRQLLNTRAHHTNPNNSFVFMFSTSATLGCQLWVSFVSGQTMLRILPRHQVGLVQSQLFPKYFFLTSLFTFGSFYSYLKENPVNIWTNEYTILGYLLGGSFVLNVLNLVLFGDQTIKHNQRMHQIEKNAGVGVTTVGKLMHANKIDSDPEYVEARKKFRIYHGLSSVANFVSLASTVAQFYYLTNKGFFSF